MTTNNIVKTIIYSIALSDVNKQPAQQIFSPLSVNKLQCRQASVCF